MPAKRPNGEARGRRGPITPPPLGWIPGVPQWDEPFVVLAMGASVEAIFLSTFVLISQNRMQAAADKRAELDLRSASWPSTR